MAGDVPQARPVTGSSSSASGSGSENGEGSSSDSEDSGAEAAASNPAAVLDAEAAAVEQAAAQAAKQELASQEAEIRRLEMLAAAQKMVAEETARLAAVEEAKVQEQREAAEVEVRRVAAEVEVRRLAEQKEADDKLKAAAFLLALQENPEKKKRKNEKGGDKSAKKSKKASASHSLLDSAKVTQNVQPVDDDDEQELTHERTGREDYKRYSLSPGPVRVLAEFVVDCPPGMNQRPRDDEFCRVLIHSLLEKGVSMFSQPLALMLNEAMVSSSYNDMLFFILLFVTISCATSLSGRWSKQRFWLASRLPTMSRSKLSHLNC